MNLHFGNLNSDLCPPSPHLYLHLHLHLHGSITQELDHHTKDMWWLMKALLR